MLTRLIYASASAHAMGPHDIESLLQHARQANQRRDLTGALIFSHDSYLQALEGDREVVSTLYTRLAADPRHQRLVILSCGPIAERVFADWSMAFAPADASHRLLFLKHGVSSRLEPHALHADAALQLLRDLTQGPAHSTGRRAEPVAA